MVNEKQLHDQRVRDYARQARKDAAKPPHDDGYHYRILGIHKIRSDQTFRFTHAKIAANDPRLRDKLVMVQMAKDIQTQSLKINGYDPALSYAIRAAIQGEPPLFHWLGEFFQNYGMFQAKYGVFKTKETRDKLTEMLGDTSDAWYDGYLDGRKPDPQPERVPLPLAVRNILAHPEHKNDVTYAQIKRASQVLADMISSV